MKASILMALVIGFSTQIGWGWGDEKGNGGGAIQCPGRPLEILDFFEARQMKLGEPHLGSGQSIEELAQEYLSRLAITSPQRSEQFREWLQNFENEFVMVSSVPIEYIEDLGVEIPAGCQWRQIVNQNPLLLPSGKKYLVDRRAWEELSNLQKVGLMFHEFFYRQSNSWTSKGLRFLNALVATDRLREFSLSQRLSLFREAGLSWMEAQGLAFQINSEVQLDQERLVRARTLADSVYVWRGQKLRLREALVDFFETGSPQALCISNVLQMRSNETDLSFHCPANAGPSIRFHENGEIKNGVLAKSVQLESPYFSLVVSGSVDFYSSGLLQSAIGNLGNVSLEGHEYAISPGSRLSLYPNGRIQSFHFSTRVPGQADGKPLPFWVWGQAIYPKNESPLNFGVDGSLQDFISSRKGSLKTLTGDWIRFEQDEWVVLGHP